LKKERTKRIRRLVHNLNKAKRQQAKKIDILCNDIIAAQRGFIKKVQTLSFVVDFFESIAGQTDLSIVLPTAVNVIKEAIYNTDFAVFLLEPSNFQVHLFESQKDSGIDGERLIECFTLELVNNICDSNKLCCREDMFAMALQGNLTMLDKLCLVAVPLYCSASPVGFILAYRSGRNKFKADELDKIAAITPGLACVIKSCQSSSPTTKPQ